MPAKQPNLDKQNNGSRSALIAVAIIIAVGVALIFYLVRDEQLPADTGAGSTSAVEGQNAPAAGADTGTASGTSTDPTVNPTSAAPAANPP